TNGSFENAAFQFFHPGPGGVGGWGFATVPGWTNTGGTLEVWDTPFRGTIATDGQRVIETDTDGRVDDISQTVSVHNGYDCLLSFDFASRTDGPGLATDSDAFQIWWNGHLVGSFDPNSTNWTHAVLNLVGAGSADSLEIREAGANDGFGAMLDNFKLVVD